jgi:hypothetical protein
MSSQFLSVGDMVTAKRSGEWPVGWDGLVTVTGPGDLDRGVSAAVFCVVTVRCVLASRFDEVGWLLQPGITTASVRPPSAVRAANTTVHTCRNMGRTPFRRSQLRRSS